MHRSHSPVKLRSHSVEYFFTIVHDIDKFSNRKNLKPIGMMKMHTTVYPNIFECVSDHMKIHLDRSFTFYRHFANEAR